MEFESSRDLTNRAEANFAKTRLAAPGRWVMLLIFFLFDAALPAQTRIAQGAAQSPANAPASHLFTDEIGRRVEVPAAVEHIVSLAPNLTEIVFALGKGDHLAGDTDFCDYPAEAAQKPRVGGPVNPNLEEIVALTPDLILATRAINRRETVEALARIGLPVYVTDPHSVDEMITSVEHVGEVLHAEKAAAALVGDLRERLSYLDRRIAATAPRRVLFVVWTDPLISIGSGTFIADALHRAGARSVVDTAAEWPRLNLEEIIRLQPEVLVFASAHAGDTQHDIDALRTRPGWRDLDALRRGKIVVISDAINRPAPRMVDAVEQLAHALHPDSFGRGGSPANAAHIAEEACACAR
jgi:iron complex transport system substrate-binding protein